MKTLNTVNVIEFAEGEITLLTAYPDTTAGNKAAEAHFAKFAKKHGCPACDIESYIEDGYYENESYENGTYKVNLVHST